MKRSTQFTAVEVDDTEVPFYLQMRRQTGSEAQDEVLAVPLPWTGYLMGFHMVYDNTTSFTVVVELEMEPELGWKVTSWPVPYAEDRDTFNERYEFVDPCYKVVCNDGPGKGKFQGYVGQLHIRGKGRHHAMDWHTVV
jgi:hypothetical protein